MFATRRGRNKIFLSEAARKAIGDPEYVAVTRAGRAGKRTEKKEAPAVYVILPAAADDADARWIYTRQPGRFSCSWLSNAMPAGERVPLAKARGGLEVRL